MKRTKRLLLLLLPLLMAFVLLPLFSAKAAASRIVDKALLFSRETVSELESKIADIESRYGTAVVIYTTYKLEDPGLKSSYESIKAFSEDYFDYVVSGGIERDGIMLCVDMDPLNRGFYICTSGSEVSRFEGYMDRILDDLYGYFSDSDYDGAAQRYVKYVDQLRHYGFMPPSVGRILICLGIGAVAAMIVTGGMRASMKSVHQATAARNYAVPGSFRVHRINETFLYRHVTQTARQTSSGRVGGGGGGGGVFFGGGGSSGFSHGGGGRRF